MELEITAALPGSTCLVYMTTMLLRTGAVVSASLGTSPGHTTQCRWEINSRITATFTHDSRDQLTEGVTGGRSGWISKLAFEVNNHG